MPLVLDDFHQLQKKVERTKKEADMAAGSLQQLLSQLKKQHGVDSLEEAEHLLKSMIDDENEALKKYNKAKKEFEASYGELTEDD